MEKIYKITFFRHDGWGMFDKTVKAESPEAASMWAYDFIAKHGGVYSFEIRKI